MPVRCLALVCLLALLTQSATAQIPGLGKSGDSAAAPVAPVDPLGRSTPRGSIVELSRVAERDDFTSAALFMQLRSAAQRRNAPQLAGDLKKIIDSELHESLSRISDAPAGDLEDGLPPDRDHIGPINVEAQKFYIELVRMPNKDSGPIWLISAESLDEIPLIASALGKTWIERSMPAWM